MKIVKPIEINESRLLYSSIPEPDPFRGEIEWIADAADSIQLQNTDPNFTTWVTQWSDFGFLAINNSSVDGIRRYDSSFNYIDTVNVGISFPLYCMGACHVPGIDGKSSGLLLAVRDNSDKDRIQIWKFSDFSLTSKVVEMKFTVGPPFTDTGNVDVKGLCTDGASIYLTLDNFLAGTDFGLPSVGGVYIVKYMFNDVPTSIDYYNLYGGLNLSSVSMNNDKIAIVRWNYDTSKDGIAEINYHTKQGALSSTKTTNIKYRDYATGKINAKSILNSELGEYIFEAESQSITRFSLSPTSPAAYANGDEVVKVSTHRRYRSAKDGNIDDPELGVTLSPPSWVDIGPTNKWAMFDKKPSIQSVNGDEVKITIRPSQFTQSISGFNLSGVNTVNVKVIDDIEGEIYNQDIKMNDNSRVVGLLSYFTSPLVYKSDFTIASLPSYRASNIELTMSGSNIRAGAVLVGDYIQIGRELAGTSYNSNPITIRTPDGFGGFDITRRGVSDTISFKVGYQKPEFEFIRNTLKSIDGLYCVFIGEGDVGAGLTTYGLLDPFNAPIETPTANELTFDVIGVL